ncbi:MAG: EamA/RhaT family transporter [Castellaniella sp.]|uniref:EamA/RhaT family transporter n=1 Tax=Castellaniella sp. TaxID=1955812 RepID=UPI002A35CF93|nr:EamA/RhaT family transporter [Castellaniella sp.]MDY0309884.1 EamA/RhaT family transporter [Castellaniella sp.]
MHTLILSIAFSVAVSIFLKLARRSRIHIDQAIAVNYATAVGLCLWLLRPPLDTLFDQSPAAWLILSLLGVLLPSVFLIMAAAVRRAGIVRSDTAQRLSLILPILAAFLVFHEAVSMRKAFGIALALCALACLLARPRTAAATPTPGETISDDEARGTAARGWQVLLGVWLGYGCIDILFKQMARIGAGFTGSLLLSFTLAGLLMGLWLLARRTRWHARSLASGLLLGGLNFGNIYCYIRAHQTFPDNPTLVFAAMNIGVISIGTLVGAGLFRERLNAVNILGIGLALGAIVLLFPR